MREMRENMYCAKMSTFTVRARYYPNQTEADSIKTTCCNVRLERNLVMRVSHYLTISLSEDIAAGR